jgi:hypothetical protein
MPQILFRSDGAAARTFELTLGAKLGANLPGREWTAMDALGHKGLPFLPVRTAADTRRHRLEI